MENIFFVILSEVLLIPIFALINIWLDYNHKFQIELTSWLKGVLERAFLIYLLISGFEGAALILFGAIKLGTRVEQDKGHKVNNDYFLIGNVLSIAAAVLEYQLLKDVLPVI